MPSGKRNRGRARRARQRQAVAAPSSSDEALRMRKNDGQSSHLVDDEFAFCCWHGFTTPRRRRGAAWGCMVTFVEDVNRFLRKGDFGDNFAFAGAHEIINVEFPCSEEVDNNDTWEELKAIIFDNGVHDILLGGRQNTLRASASAAAVMMLDCHDEVKTAKTLKEALDSYWKWVDKSGYRGIFDRCERTIIKWYYKRASCSCLGDAYRKSKILPKVGHCFNCNERKAKSELKVCGVCRRANYCSIKCQESDWPSHKLLCKTIKANVCCDEG